MSNLVSILVASILGAFFLGFAVLMFWNEVERSDGRKACLAAGYPEVRYYAWDVYCLKRENNSDVMKKLD